MACRVPFYARNICRCATKTIAWRPLQASLTRSPRDCRTPARLKRASALRARGHQKQRAHQTVCSLLLVDPRRIELLSENLFTGPSSWTVYDLEFPLDGDHRQPSPAGSPLMHDRYKCELPIHVHHYVTPRSRPWYSLMGRAAIMPRHCLN